MKTINKPSLDQWTDLCLRPVSQEKKLESSVREIMGQVRTQGKIAIQDYCEKYDKYRPEALQVPLDEIKNAGNLLSRDLKKAIKRAAWNIELFHRNQQKDLPIVYISRSIQCWQKDVPIEKVGLYVPGGTAPLFSTVLMLGVPARIAGCNEIALCTPASEDGKIHPATLYAADLCGIHHVYRIGGVQAIAAMAYGIDSIPVVDKIYGPGNQYVTLAKQLVVEEGIAIDMPAGPSEVLVMADETANPAFVAADILSQAEHGADSQAVLLCQSKSFAEQVQKELEEQLDVLPRKELAAQSIENSLTLIFDQIDEMMSFSNRYAPEHLILALEQARYWADHVTNAGSVFIGHYTPESAGDYASGTNHTLPTNGYARAYSGLNLQSFMKTIQYQEIQVEGLVDLGPDIKAMAEAEGLVGHANAVSIRLEKDV